MTENGTSSSATDQDRRGLLFITMQNFDGYDGDSQVILVQYLKIGSYNSSRYTQGCHLHDLNWCSQSLKTFHLHRTRNQSHEVSPWNARLKNYIKLQRLLKASSKIEESEK